MLDDIYADQGADRPIRMTKDLWDILEERSAAHEANPSHGHTWEEVVAFVKREKPVRKTAEGALVAAIRQLAEVDRNELFEHLGEQYGDRMHELFGDVEDTIEITEAVSRMLEERSDCTWDEVVAFVKQKK
jgi:hypothetical protein